MAPPPSKRSRRSKIPQISLSVSRVLNSNTPILDQDIHGFIVTTLSPAVWDQYSEAEKRQLINLFPTAFRTYELDENGKLDCPVSTEFLQSDTYVKAGVARFKRDVKDGYWEAKWQDQARQAMQERREGKFDEYLLEHAEEWFGDDTGDHAGEEDEGHSERDSGQEHGSKNKNAEEDEYAIERLLRFSPAGTEVEVKWSGHKEPTWESRAGLLEDVPDMVAVLEARQIRNLEPAFAQQAVEQTTAQGKESALPGSGNVAEAPDVEMNDAIIDAVREM